MSEVLGYARFGAHGGTVFGGIVTSALGRLLYPHEVIGIHLDFPTLGLEASELSEEEQTYIAALGRSGCRGRRLRAYAAHQTSGITLAYGLNNSPAGPATWMSHKIPHLERLRRGSGAALYQR